MTTMDEFMTHLLAILPEYAIDTLEFILALPSKEMHEYLLMLGIEKSKVDTIIKEKEFVDRTTTTKPSSSSSSSSSSSVTPVAVTKSNTVVPVKGTTEPPKSIASAVSSATTVSSSSPSSSSSSSSAVPKSSNPNPNPTTTSKPTPIPSSSKTGNVTNATGSYAVTKNAPIIPPLLPSTPVTSSSVSSSIPTLRPADYPVVPLCPCMATKHKCLCNCIHCGKIICEYEANRYCTFCLSLLIAVQNIAPNILDQLRYQAESKDEEEILNLPDAKMLITKESSSHSKQGNQKGRITKTTNDSINTGGGSNKKNILIDKDTADFLLSGTRRDTKDYDPAKTKKGLALSASATEFTPRGPSSSSSVSAPLPTVSSVPSSIPSDVVSLPLYTTETSLANQDASFAAAIQHRNKLLDFDRNSTARTVVRDDDNEWFDTNRGHRSGGGGELTNHVTYDTWLSPEENQRRIDAAQERAEKAAERKRGIRLQFDFTGGRVDVSTETALDDDHYVQEQLLNVVRTPIPGFPNGSKANTSTGILNNTAAFPSLSGTVASKGTSTKETVPDTTVNNPTKMSNGSIFANPTLHGKSAEVYREIMKTMHNPSSSSFETTDREKDNTATTKKIDHTNDKRKDFYHPKKERTVMKGSEDTSTVTEMATISAIISIPGGSAKTSDASKQKFKQQPNQQQESRKPNPSGNTKNPSSTHHRPPSSSVNHPSSHSSTSTTTTTVDTNIGASSSSNNNNTDKLPFHSSPSKHQGQPKNNANTQNNSNNRKPNNNNNPQQQGRSSVPGGIRDGKK